MVKVTKRYIKNLIHNKQKVQYLLDRGLTWASIKKFGIGLSLSKQTELISLLPDRDKYLNEGLLQKNSNGKIYPFFSSRIMIPFKSVSGKKIIGYTGRTIYSIDNRYLTQKEINAKEYFKKENIDLAKYKNSMESKSFKKSEYLYNLDSITSSSVIIFESQLNCIACHQLQQQGVRFDLEGIDTIPHPVATGGTSLTEKHIDLLLKNGVMNITLCFDGDRAGIKATKRAIEMLLKRREILGVSVISMPLNTDLMDLIKQPIRVKNLVNKIRFAEQWLCDFYEYQERAFDKKLKSMVDFKTWWANSSMYSRHDLMKEFEETAKNIKNDLCPVNGKSIFHNYLNNHIL
jgi:DNA primase